MKCFIFYRILPVQYFVQSLLEGRYIGIGGVSSHGDAQGVVGLVAGDAHGLEDVARLQGVAGAGAAAGDADAELVEAQYHGLALPLIGQAVDDVGEEVLAAGVHLHRGLDAADGAHGRIEAVAQGAQAGGLLRLGFLGRLQGGDEAGDAGDVLGAAAATGFLTAAQKVGGEGSAGLQVQGAHALGAADLVSREGSRIHAELLHIERHLAQGLHGIGVEQRGMIVRDTGEIGDDEHGWDDDGVFNFEGGCYAKTINLDPQAEPEIYRAIRRNALLENVVVRADGSVDYADGSKTENTRVSYPLSHIENIVKPVSRAGHPSKVIFLAADAFGVLPPVSRLTTEQMQYHFLSGFTSKLAGTERGITQPTPTFSACYGAAFLLLHPTQYASVLAAKMAEAGAEAWLVNTGWNGEGKRLSLRDTRNIISAILNGTTGELREETVPVFGLAIPQSVPGVDSALLDPRSGWPSADKWQEKAESLAQLFMDNFKQYSDTDAGARLALAGPTLAKSAVTA